MKVLTQQHYDKLISNGNDRDKDHPPVVKLFMTNTNCTWLISELDPEYPDIAFGLCDLGMGFPELGYVSLTEIKEAEKLGRMRFLERDTSFQGKYPMTVYARAARAHEYIVTDEKVLERYVI
jgi:Protein of unknown function (DUF2958)